MKLSFDEPLKLATGGNGGGLVPPERRAFATPRPDNNGARREQEPEPIAAPAPAPTPNAIARKAKLLRKLMRRIPRARMAKELAEFRAGLAAWQARQPGYDPHLMARRAHESKIRAAFRAKHKGV
jgi:hypothetical protein